MHPLIKKVLDRQEKTMHSWGDSWPHWDELYKAQRYFEDLYFKCTGKHPSTKEKWGTIRYEFTWSWVENEEHGRIFREAIRRTIKKFPNVAAEVCIDAGFVIDDAYFEGWCAGVAFKAKGSYWSSTKRPNGV